MTYDKRPEASHFINGDDVEDTSGTGIDVICPATGEKFATVNAASAVIIECTIAHRQAAPALTCGNAMTLKSSEMGPLCALKVAGLLQEAGVPSAIDTVVQGMGELGNAPVTGTRVDRVSLTGLVPRGRRANGAAAGGRHVIMELGGKSPLVVFDDPFNMAIAGEENFGPVMAVLDFEDEDDVIAHANDTEFGLAAGVFTKELTCAQRAAERFEAGACFINTYNDAPVEAPFGGSKNSGVRRENSKAAIERYSQLKSVFVRIDDVEASF